MNSLHLRWSFLIILGFMFLLNTPMTNATTDSLDLKLSGSFDLLENEKIHLQLSVLVTDRATGVPISGAEVNFKVYDPGWILIMDGVLSEDVEDSGVYLSKSEMTIKDMDLPSGIYCVSVRVTFPSCPIATDMIQFHIKPPNSNDDYLHTKLPLLIELVLGVVTMVALPIIQQRRFVP